MKEMILYLNGHNLSSKFKFYESIKKLPKISESYGYRVRANMTQCAGDTREGILSESLIDVRNESIHEALNDPMSLLRCDIRLKINIPRLSQEQIDLIAQKLSTADHTIVAEFERNQCTKGDLSTLNGLQWLNDEVINYYLQLIRNRSDKSSYLPAVHCFNTFLYPKLKSKGHSAVKRWTKKINLFDFQMVFFPIHLGKSILRLGWSMDFEIFQDIIPVVPRPVVHGVRHF